MKQRVHQKRVLLALGNKYIERVHHSVAQFAGENNWHLSNIFGDSPDLIRNRACDGVIAALDSADKLSDAVLSLDLPVVDLSIIREDLEIIHMTGSNRAMGSDAARHFLDRGFRNFAWLTERKHAVSQQRLEGYRTRLNAEGFDCVELAVEDAFVDAKPSWSELRDWLLDRLGRLSHPCALFVYNDFLAADLIDACMAGGVRVPDDVAVLGVDNHPLVCPLAAVPLSSINHDLEGLGRRAAYELSRLMDGAPTTAKIIEVQHLGITVRQSSDIFAINDPAVAAALRFIQSNFHRSIGVNDVVGASGASRRYLERRFRKNLRKSIQARIKEARLDNASRMLKETSYSIADIASLSGFNTAEYLHRVFLKEVGMTPRSFRMSCREDRAPMSG